MSSVKKPIFTISHSLRSTRDFMKILEIYDIQVLVDVRRITRSKTNPQFGKTRLKQSLKRHKIEYVHLEALGDLTQSDEFKVAFDELVKIAKTKIVVMMCADALGWGCHRSLIAETLLVHDFNVIEIFDEKIARPHHHDITYPGEF